MPMKMMLEPQEWLMVGDTRVINVHPLKAKFIVEGSGPVLRQAHTMTFDEADTSAKRAYLAVQRLYLGLITDMSEYQRAVSELLKIEPSSKETVLRANMHMANGSLYGALREYRKLMELEVA